MSFFDKLFSNRNRSHNNENVFKAESEGLRECDKRGRKLLFDSSSVEKIQLPSKENMCNHKCQQQNERFDFIEITKTHGYKYKKPSSDVSSLGEMVFGSVAVVYKAENSCKIHCIPSPKRLMFTAIVHAPFHRSSSSRISELNLDQSSSLLSLTNILNEQLTTSSDSKLYRHEGVFQKYSSTYPWIKHSFPVYKIKQCCEISDVDFTLSSKPLLSNSSDPKCLKSIYSDKRISDSEKYCMERNFSTPDGHNICLCQKNSDCEGNSLSNYGSSGITSNESESISSVSESLSSLRRRWTHSYSTSLDSTSYDDTSNSPSKKRTKLGMALILDLSNTLENEIEKLLFNHTILIDSIMCKLQDSVELAYIRNDHFVDIIYSAFSECQENIYELITGGKYETPVWCTILGDPEDNLETHIGRMNFYKKCTGTCDRRGFVNNVQLKFLNNFCDVLVKFDTKDTNFFISTLLTAVLTHHLSWVASVVEADAKSPNDKLSVVRHRLKLCLYLKSGIRTVLLNLFWLKFPKEIGILYQINAIRPYNPIWAQMNDLCGLLGSPLTSAKTIIIGPESRKNQLATIIEVLNYFIRCNNVVENIYEVDIEDIIGNTNFENHKTCHDSAIDSNIQDDSSAVHFKKQSFKVFHKSEIEKSNDEEQESSRNLKTNMSFLEQSNYEKGRSRTGLKRNRSYYFDTNMKDVEKSNELYPDIKNLAKSENINIGDLDYDESELTIFVENFLSSEELKGKIQKMIRVPSANVIPHVQGHLSPDEGYNTIDLMKTDNFKENKVQLEMQRSAPEKRSENIVFLLGENEELVSLQKKIIVNKSSFVDMEKEGPKEFSSEVNEFSSCKNNESKIKKLENVYDDLDRTLWVNHGDGNVVEHSLNKDDGQQISVKVPLIVREMRMPRATQPCLTRRLEVSSVLGGVNQHYNSQQVIQGVLKQKSLLEQKLQKDLYLSAHNQILEKNVKEALCIVGDMDSWEVTIFSSNKSVLDYNKKSGVRVGMSQLVADMLESLLYLHTSNLAPSFCLCHIEEKLQEIYLKSKTVAEFLNSTELCSMDYLTTSLDIGISDVPLLLSVATTHSPHIAEKYTLSYS